MIGHKSVLFISPDITDSRVKKRLTVLNSMNFTVHCFSFIRSRYNYSAGHDYSNVHIVDTIKDRSYIYRIFSLVKLFRAIFNHLRRMHTDYIYAVNLDNLFIAIIAILFSRKKDVKVIYEVADIVEIMNFRFFWFQPFKRFESILLRYVDALVTTSDGFLENYFSSELTCTPYLVENKLSPAFNKSLSNVHHTFNKERIRIGYFGAIRCKTSFDILITLAKTLTNVEVVFAGKPTRLNNQYFFSSINELDNVKYLGEYDNRYDLDRLYNQIDISFLFELVLPNTNSKWLLPNRLYESGFYNVPCLAPSDTKTGRFIVEHKMGWVVDKNYFASLNDLLLAIDEKEYQRVEASMKLLNRDLFYSDKQFMSVFDEL